MNSGLKEQPKVKYFENNNKDITKLEWNKIISWRLRIQIIYVYFCYNGWLKGNIKNYDYKNAN